MVRLHVTVDWDATFVGELPCEELRDALACSAEPLMR
jgi:hypothetical protein